MRGQISIDGEELSGFYTVIPGLATVEWPESEPLTRTTRIVVQTEYVVTHVSDGAGVDAHAISKETVRRAYITAPDKATVKVVNIIRPQSEVKSA
jgi:hypothetical protein